MIKIGEWPHRWFGVWKEYGPAFQDCPSIHDFVDHEVAAGYDKVALRRYLTEAEAMAATSRICFPSPFTGKHTGGSICYRTDGEWVWLDDLADYVDQYDVVLPTAFMRNIEKNNHVPPQVDQATMDLLEGPPVRT